MNLAVISFAPVIIIACYIYFRDKYEKEPLRLLMKALAAGALAVIPVVLFESLFTFIGPGEPSVIQAGYTAFIVAGITEETFKFLVFILFIWRNQHFNEKFDGIVYAVFISLGFAAVENLLYVTQLGFDVGVSRALTAVPAHALFGIVMGYHLGIAKMIPERRTKHMLLGLLVPILLHGIYDFIIMSGHPLALAIFLPYLVFLWFNGFRKMKVIAESSRFKSKQIHEG